ncbi:MAG TPA: hypothetical protein PL007_02925, partial [Thermomonas sp.]|nr:hypothetical protein [Thermomonas sp.]
AAGHTHHWGIAMSSRTTLHMRRLSIALLAALTMPVMAQQADPKDSSSDSKVKTLDRMTVTGSRIQRTDVETALPITIIQRAEIDAQGITSAEQLLQQLNVASNGPDSLAANSGVAPPGTRGNNGVSGANLRGQGGRCHLGAVERSPRGGTRPGRASGGSELDPVCRHRTRGSAA